MTEPPDNVVPLRPTAKDPTAALRAARYRARHKKPSRKKRKKASRRVTDHVTPGVTETVTERDAERDATEFENLNEIKPDVTVSERLRRYRSHDAKPPDWRHGGGGGFDAFRPASGVDKFAFLAALALASVSTWFSVTGLTAIFVGAYWPVIAMGGAFEFAKLSAAAWLARYAAATGSWLRIGLVVLILSMVALDIVGAYGFLARAHISHAVEGSVVVAGRAASLDARLDRQAVVVTDLDRRISQIDAAVEGAAKRGRGSGAMRLADDQRRNRAGLAAERERQGQVLADLKVQRAGVEGQMRMADADLGPIRFLAILIGASDQAVLRWFIMIVACLIEPMAVLLLYAASRGRRA